ncbi:MAG TPA: GYF domain-containing protein [Nannocystaceae bacterium]|nr:GYF domain-containing protein [Nannocystaceae bacterium]
MKIECDKCSAKYSIADEKVRGKTFKIRCKKCSNVIIVRDKAAADGNVLGGDDGAGAAGWHLAINGETVGPMAEDEVRQRFRSGDIDRDTAVWQEGFEDWVPLGDVETFADLASSAGAAAADPFASANQEDYAATQALHGGAAVAASPVAAPVAARAAGGGMAVAEPSSPRVTRLTGQRNENSVLFSLDSLQALATGGGGGASGGAAARSAAPSRQGPRSLATVAPSSEGSGLIDIRALGAMVGSDAAPAGGHASSSAKSVDDATLPSFGGANLGGLASTPLTPQVAAVDHHMQGGAHVQQRSNAPLYVLMVLLLVGIVGLAAYVVLRKPEQVIVEKTVPGEPAPSVKGGADDDEDKDDKDKDDKDKEKDEEGDKDEDGEAAEGEAAEGEEKAEGGDDKTPDSGKSSAKKPNNSSSSKSSHSSSTPKPSTPSTPKPTPAPSNNSLDVDCILDPNLPKCKGGGSSKSPSTPKPTPAPSDPNLPESLNTTDIKAGVAPVKDAAKSCGAKHGASPGEKVKVKLSIAGATGAVTSASAEPPHQGTPLGNCVAAALKKAKFKKFKKPSLGAVYPVSM